MLEIYDMQLVEFGYNIIRDRIKYIEGLNKYAEKIHSDITSGKEKINFKLLYIGENCKHTPILNISER